MQTSKTQTLQTLFSKNTNAAQTLQKITAFARERMNLNPLVRLFFCLLLFLSFAVLFPIFSNLFPISKSR